MTDSEEHDYYDETEDVAMPVIKSLQEYDSKFSKSADDPEAPSKKHSVKYEEKTTSSAADITA